MKTKDISVAILREIAEKEYHLVTDALTKSAIVEAIGNEEIADEVYEQYKTPPSVGATKDVASTSVPTTMDKDQLIAFAKQREAEDKAILQACQAERSKYLGEPIECSILITGISDRFQVKTTIKTRPNIAMVTITGVAFPDTDKIECKVTVNVEDCKLEVGQMTSGRIGIYKEKAREEQAAQILAERGIDIAAATKEELREAKAIVGSAQLILGDKITSLGDLIETRSVNYQLTVTHEFDNNPVVEARTERNLDLTRRLRSLMA